MCLALWTLITCIFFFPLLNSIKYCANSCNRNDLFCRCKKTHTRLQQSFSSCFPSLQLGFKYGYSLTHTGSDWTKQNINKMVKLQAFSSELDFFSVKQHTGGRFGKQECSECRLLMSHCCVFLGYFSVTSHCQLELQVCKVAQCLRKST